MNILMLLFKGGLILLSLVLIFRLSSKIMLGHDEFFDVIINKIKKCYGYIRKYFCKKSNSVDDDRRAIQNDGETYDSSSVWED